MFFLITKNLNWEISSTNLVTFEIEDGSKDEKKKYFCFWDSLKSLPLGQDRFADLKEGYLARKR